MLAEMAVAILTRRKVRVDADRQLAAQLSSRRSDANVPELGLIWCAQLAPLAAEG